MTISRRTFMGHVTAQLAAAGLLRAQGKSIERLGVQLYTVRDLMEKDFEGTLARVAGLGYKEVEFAGYFKQSSKEVKAILARHALASPSTHIDYASLGDGFPKVVEASAAIGHRYIVNPWLEEDLRKQPDVWKRVAATFNRAGEISKKAGIQFAYHNHHFEFVPVNGVMPYDVLLKECDPDLVKMELDLCWITVARQDPLTYFRAVSGTISAGARQGTQEAAGRPAARTVRAGDPEHHRCGGRRHHRLEAHLRRGWTSRNPALLRRARPASFSTRQPADQRALPVNTAFLGWAARDQGWGGSWKSSSGIGTGAVA